MNKNLLQHVLYSGGAYGADAIWGKLAHQYGVGKQFHIRPVGNTKIHKNLTSRGYTPLVAQAVNLDEARAEIKRLIGLELTPSLGSDLKARNYFQVSKSESVLAVAHLNSDNTVKGGTDVAVQLGIALELPVYVLDVTTEDWFMYDYCIESFVVFGGTPLLTRKFTGVGTRDIENYNIKDKLTGEWVSRAEFVGQDKANRLIAKMEDVFKLATRN